MGLYPDKDQFEGPNGNESTDNAFDVSVAAGASTTVHGRLSFIGDMDTYKVTAGATQRLHYKLSYSAASDDHQFAAVPTLNPKTLTVFTVDKTPNCFTQCPYPDARSKSYVDDWCRRGQRQEDAKISNFANFEGELLLTAGMTYYFQYGFTGGNGADDVTYDLQLDGLAGDVQHGDSNPTVVNMDTSEGTTTFGWGYGAVNLDSTTGSGKLPRSILDYDAEIPREVFQFNFTPDGVDHAFQLQWTIDKSSTGVRAYDVGVAFTFCGDAGCATKVYVPKGGGIFGYTDGTTNPWYLGEFDAGYEGMQKEFDLNQASGQFKIRDTMCVCLDKAYNTGKFYVAVIPYGRTTYADSTTHLQFKLGPYPIHAVNDQGTAFDCPSPCGWVGWYK